MLAYGHFVDRGSLVANALQVRVYSAVWPILINRQWTSSWNPCSQWLWTGGLVDKQGPASRHSGRFYCIHSFIHQGREATREDWGWSIEIWSWAVLARRTKRIHQNGRPTRSRWTTREFDRLEGGNASSNLCSFSRWTVKGMENAVLPAGFDKTFINLISHSVCTWNGKTRIQL